ncbi:MAG TPA: hypothetical protein VLA32_11745 [Anaerolineales bacterium]|jgi:hypothetical protein|nr:hypothetical protein [Anaerolineales bacterium]
MTTKIERVDQQRGKNRQGFLVWSTIFFISWFIRSGLKIAEVENDTVFTVLLVVLIISLVLQVVYMFKDHRLDVEMKQDPRLKEAMNDERIQLNELRAWKVGFFALIGFIIFAAIVSLLIEINDMMLVYLTALLIGFGARNTAVYLLDR